MILAIVGGASGVGKTTLLGAIPGLQIFNTGTFFTERIKLASRDDVRKSDWSIFEEEVLSDLSRSVLTSLDADKTIVIDTHFAAKIHGRQYRIGLKRNLIFLLGKDIFLCSEKNEKMMIVRVVLINTDPHSLLLRRRMDNTRDREIVPSDCLNDLLENRKCAGQYLSELIRAQRQICGSSASRVKYDVVENNDFYTAKNNLLSILEEG